MYRCAAVVLVLCVIPFLGWAQEESEKPKTKPKQPKAKYQPADEQAESKESSAKQPVKKCCCEESEEGSVLVPVTEWTCPLYESPPGSGFYYAQRCADREAVPLFAQPGLGPGNCDDPEHVNCVQSSYEVGPWRVAPKTVQPLQFRPNRNFVLETEPGRSEIIGSLIVDFQREIHTPRITAKCFLIKLHGINGAEPIIAGFGLEIQPDQMRPDVTLIGPDDVCRIQPHLYQLKTYAADFLVLTHATHP